MPGPTKAELEEENAALKARLEKVDPENDRTGAKLANVGSPTKEPSSDKS